MQPRRIQLKRTKGWKMPPNTVSVTRPGKFGNPFTINEALRLGFAGDECDARKFVVDCFRDWLMPVSRRTWWEGPESDARKSAIKDGLAEIRGKNLACWCALDQPCHADVLLEIANAPEAVSPVPHQGGHGADPEVEHHLPDGDA